MQLLSKYLALAAALPLSVASSSSPSTHCSAKYLQSGINIPNHAKLLDLVATPVLDAPVNVTGGKTSSVRYCSVVVTYTHPSFNDTINLTTFLPLNGWNGRFQGVGGGGWAANSGSTSLLSPVANGYSAGNTDAGHIPNGLSSASWARKSNGELNIPLLEDFAYLALEELAVVGKQLSNRFYGYGPHHSYWNGCSTGGRQGLMMAQRYPTLYDGIYAASPAIHWESFQVAQYWGQFLMNQYQHYPPACAYDTITAAAVAACDGLDGVKDGVIAALSKCHFHPHTLVGKAANCTNTPYTITRQDAEIALKVWQGPRTADGSFLWWGINPGTEFEGLTNTTCVAGTNNCTNNPFPISTDWTGDWVLNNPNFNFQSLTLQSYSAIFPSAYRQYHEIVGTENPDLSAFRKNGGKMITWHGLADQLIYPEGTESYYEEVEHLDPNVRDFYRFFPAPGVMHCGGGAGEVPNDPFDAVVNWREKGVAPATLPATSVDGMRTRNLCQYPLVSVYQGGDPKSASSFTCGTAFGDMYDEDYFSQHGHGYGHGKGSPW